ncbi:MAG: Ig-like domain-containing protein [bacterium]
MKKKFFMVLLMFAILSALSTVSQAQVIAPSQINSQLPLEILTGLIGKYATMLGQYQYIVASGGKPDSVVELRLAANIDFSSSSSNLGIDPILDGVSKVAFWINANIFARQPSTLGLDLSGTFGNIELMSTEKGIVLISRDESVYSYLPDSLKSLPQSNPSVFDLLPMPLDQLQEQIAFLIMGLPDFNMRYEGLKSTSKGMAHIVQLVPSNGNVIATLWILDETWDLFKIEFMDTQNVILATMIIENIELVTSLPDSTFDIDTAGLAEISYDNFVGVIGLKLLSAMLNGAPVVADLYASSKEVRQGEQIMIFADGLDATDSESDLMANIEYKSPNGSWTAMESIYDGKAPFGSWKASFVPTDSNELGYYDFRVTFIDKDGVSSDPFVLSKAVKVIATSPRIISVSPASGEKNVSKSTNIIIKFNQEMNKESVESAFSLSGKTLGYFEWSDNSLIFTPTRKLNYGEKYTVKVLGSAMSVNMVGIDGNLNGISEGSPNDDVIWSFNTEPAPLPSIIEVTPLDKQEGVPVSSQITVNFSRPMDQQSVENTFSMISYDGKSVSGSFLWLDNNTMSFIPTIGLDYNATYKLRILGTAKSDIGTNLDGNGNGKSEGTPTDDVLWWFSTEKAQVLSTRVKPVKAISEASEGDIISVDIMAENVTQLNSFMIKIAYNKNVLRVLKVERESFANWRPKPRIINQADIWLPTEIDVEKGIIAISATKTRDDGVSGTGRIATITFQAIDIGESPIKFIEVSFVNISGDVSIPILREGMINVKATGIWDINGDGVVDINDFIAIQTGNGFMADVNGDGVINILDIVALKNQSVDFKLWDINQDGVIDIQDFIISMKGSGLNPDVNGDGVVDILDIVAALGGAKGTPSLIPLVSELGTNYPNPLNPETWIPFKLANDSEVVLRIYNSKGQLVRTLDLGYKHAGVYTSKNSAAYWDGKNESGEQVASGIYFYNIKAGNFTATKKMLVLE